MAGQRITPQQSLLCALMIIAVSSAAHATDKGKVSERQIRQAAAAGTQLNQICQRAKFTANARNRCAEAMSAHCAVLRIDPASSACWQWMVNAHQRGTLDYRQVFSPKQKDGRK